MNKKIAERVKKAKKKRCRARDLGISIGRLSPGKYNSITDVKGVKVGHCTIMEGSGEKKPGKGPVRSGVTVILPSERIYDKKLIANAFILNGAGEVSGLTQLSEWGLLETPIALTNTMSVGRVSDAVINWMSQKYARLWNERQVIIPVVGECDDSFLNDSIGQHITERHVQEAFKATRGGIVEEGAVGSGTGMVCCDLKGGIGTSSRIVKIGGTKYTVGSLVMSNFGIMEDLRVDGFPMGKILSKTQGGYRRRVENYGSIIVVLATDIPLSSSQMGRLCKRASLGIGRVGSYAGHGSGEIILGFSTANEVELGKRKSKYQLDLVADEFLDTAYQASIDSTEEAILNSLTAAVDMDGVDGHEVPAMDLKMVREVIEQVNKIVKSKLT